MVTLRRCVPETLQKHEIAPFPPAGKEGGREMGKLRVGCGVLGPPIPRAGLEGAERTLQTYHSKI